jgi:hypothetical protein
MTEEIKPCWCCGHEMFVGEHKRSPGKYVVRCGSDGTNCIWFPSSGAIEKKDLPRYIAIWNARKTRKSNTHYQRLFDKSLKLNMILAVENSELKDPWISVKDRLPEKKHEVLIYYTYKANQNSYTGIAFLDKELWYSDDGKTVFRKEEVTLWMPIPELSKGGE